VDPNKKKLKSQAEPSAVPVEPVTPPATIDLPLVATEGPHPLLDDCDVFAQGDASALDLIDILSEYALGIVSQEERVRIGTALATWGGKWGVAPRNSHRSAEGICYYLQSGRIVLSVYPSIWDEGVEFKLCVKHPTEGMLDVSLLEGPWQQEARDVLCAIYAQLENAKQVQYDILEDKLSMTRDLALELYQRPCS
jgi:hypothetical protein